jgi:aryl-alcohol dehydrogenase-like predicted oxidoreductase
VNIQGTTLQTSRLGLGTHALHRLLSAAQRRDLLALAFDMGIRHFDSAPLYGDGLAERQLGQMARGRRGEIVLTTKFGLPAHRYGHVPGWNYVALLGRAARKLMRASRPGALRRDYSAAQARISLEKSLRSLGTDHVDIFFLHEPAMAFLHEPEALGRMLEGLKAGGKIRYVGLSGQHADCSAIATRYPFLADVLQVQVPGAADGLPMPDYRQPQPAAIGFWEFPAAAGNLPNGPLQQTLTRLASSLPQSVRLVSTNCAPHLREAVAVLGK